MVVVNSLEQWTKWNEILMNTDYIVSFPQNRKGSLKPPQTLCRSTMSAQSSSTLPTLDLSNNKCLKQESKWKLTQ